MASQILVPILAVSLSLPMPKGPPLSAQTIADAKAIAGRIFLAGGIQILWSDGPEAIRVQLLSHKPRNLQRDAIGFAVVGAGYVGISVPAATEVAASEEAAIATVLGATIAHELGHLLLGTSHSISGVMSPRFERCHFRNANSGMLVFTPSQSVILRQAVQLRNW